MENIPNATSEEELRELRDERRISEDEYQDLLATMRETSRMDIGPGERAAGSFYCFEYVSQTKLLDLPLVHIVLGPAWDPATGKIRVAKGIIAIGGGAWLCVLWAEMPGTRSYWSSSKHTSVGKIY